MLKPLFFEAPLVVNVIKQALPYSLIFFNKGNKGKGCGYFQLLRELSEIRVYKDDSE